MYFLNRTITFLIYFCAAIIIILLGARLFVELTGQQNTAVGVVEYTNVFLRPFAGMFRISFLENVIIYVEIFFGMLMYALWAALLEKLLTSPLHIDLRIALLDIVSAIFRIIEAVFLFRIILNLFTVNGTAPFPRLIYGVTDPIINPINTVIPNFNILFLELEISTFLVLLAILFIDYYLEYLLNYLFFGDAVDEYESDAIFYKVRKIMVREPKTVLQSQSSRSYR